MSNIQVQLRRGNTTQHGSFTGAQGEVTVDTDKNTIVVHDGATLGGHELRRKDDTVAPSEIDSGSTYTVSGLISDGANIAIQNTASTGVGLRLDKTNNSSTLQKIDLLVDVNGDLNITAPDKAANTTLMKIKNGNIINLPNIPTSSSGLSSGDVWNNSGVLNIVP